MTRELLARYPLLRLLGTTQLTDWLALGQEIDCAVGELIFQENTPGTWVWLIHDGKVRIVRQSGDREITLGMLQSGDLFGEYALLPPGRNTATCRTAAPSRLLRLPLAPLRAALQAHKPVWENLKNWLRLHTLLHFRRERAFLGFMSAGSGLKHLDRLRPATYSEGQTIQAGGVAEDFWFLIEQGTVRLNPEAAQEGAEELGAGAVFGERGLAGAGEIPTAVALTDVHCQVLTRHDIDPSAPVRSLYGQSYEPRHRERPAAHVWVPQLEETDCGLASLAMVASRLGTPIRVEELRQKAVPGPQGLSLQQLCELAGEFDLTCRAVRVSVDRLGQVKLPAVAHLSDGHYVVLHEITEAGVVIGDPARGILTWDPFFLGHCYTGSLLIFDQ